MKMVAGISLLPLLRRGGTKQVGMFSASSFLLTVENILEAEAWAGYDACGSRSLGKRNVTDEDHLVKCRGAW